MVGQRWGIFAASPQRDPTQRHSPSARCVQNPRRQAHLKASTGGHGGAHDAESHRGEAAPPELKQAT